MHDVSHTPPMNSAWTRNTKHSTFNVPPGPLHWHPDTPSHTCTQRTPQPSTCARSQVRTPPSPLRTSRPQPARPSPPPSPPLLPLPLLLRVPLPPPLRVLSPIPLQVLPPPRTQNATSGASYRCYKRATSRSSACACSIPRPPWRSPRPTAPWTQTATAISRGSSSALGLPPPSYFVHSRRLPYPPPPLLLSDRSGHPRYVVRLRKNKACALGSHCTVRCGTACVDGFVFLLRTGDDPPRDRTAELRALGFPTRHLGPVQMTTDTALGVTKRVVVDRGLYPATPCM
jgi:hypothetical protein